MPDQNAASNAPNLQQEWISLGRALAREAAARPDVLAVTCGDQSLSWRELHARTNRIARSLAKRGVKFGDFLTIALPNSVGFVEACYAAWKVGAIPQPVPGRLPLPELKAIADLADPPLVIGGVPELGRPIATVDELLADTRDESDLEDCISPAWKAPTSGGSTGRPKLIVAGSPAVWSDIGALVWRIKRDDVMLIPAPLYHNAPFTTVFSGLQAGAHVVMLPKFDPEAMLAAVARHKATWLYLVPTMMSRIWRLPEEIRAAYDISSLRTVWHLAAPCPAWLKQCWIEWLGAEAIWEMYGGTESQSITIINGKEWLEKRGSVGRVVAGEMRAFDASGRPLPPGETGEIYMKRPEGTAPTYRYIGADARCLPGGWESLGDIGWLDEDGFLFLADRRADMILVGGTNVYPAEVEAAIEEHPLVRSCAVIGLPDEDIGNRIHAIVQAEPCLDAEQLDAHMSERLVSYKRPRAYEFVDYPLRDDAGKVRRSQLRAERISEG